MSIAAGLVGGEAFSIDASLIKADMDGEADPRRSAVCMAEGRGSLPCGSRVPCSPQCAGSDEVGEPTSASWDALYLRPAATCSACWSVGAIEAISDLEE